MKYQFRFGKTIVPDGGPLSEQEKKLGGTRALFCAIKKTTSGAGEVVVISFYNLEVVTGRNLMPMKL